MSASTTAEILVFGPFQLHIKRRQLLERGEAVRLGNRALDLLIALTERAGDLVSRTELETRLWPSTVVEETSLRVHVSALRKALRDGTGGARYIANVPGRGYSFVAPLARVYETPAGETAPLDLVRDEPAIVHKLPGRIDRVIGREAFSNAIAQALRSERLVSVIGAGGMGKTTVALLVARRSLEDYVDGVRFVDLSPLPAGSPILSTVADALGLGSDTGDLWSAVQGRVLGRRMLLILDNCEHVAQASAELVERLLLAAPELRILVTSREALDVQGERVYRLEGLQTHTAPSGPELEEARHLPAIQLFVERASATAADFELRPDNLQAICDICRQLDAMPLAIELAASRVDALGVEGVAARLERMFEVLSRGRRTAYPRHRTLTALLDWSHDLLSDAERAVLRRLSMFRSSFSLELAASLCRDEQITAATVISATLSLVAKSLIAIDRRDTSLQYRLLYTTRTYAEDKLAESGEGEAWRRRYAQTLCEVIDAAADEEASPWAGVFAHMIEDLHQALEWAPDGDLEIGVKLVGSAFEFARWGGIVHDLRKPIEALIERVGALPVRQPQLELRLQTARSFLTPSLASRYSQAPSAARTLQLATEVGNTGDRIELLYALYLDAFRGANYPAALARAQDIRALAIGQYEYVSAVLSDRLLVLALHNLGDHAQAWDLAQRVLSYRPTVPVESRFNTPVPLAVSMGGVQARILWLQGSVDEALRICDGILDLRPTLPPNATCQFIGFTTLPIALWRGDLPAASALHRQLQEDATRSADPHWISLADTLGRALGAGTWADSSLPDNEAHLDLLATLSPEWLTPRALERVEAGTVGWCAPEVLRASAEKLMARGQPTDLVAAESILIRARDLAISQGAVAWQLRIADSLARLRLAQERES